MPIGSMTAGALQFLPIISITKRGFYCLYFLHISSSFKKSLHRFVSGLFSPFVFNRYKVMAFFLIFSCMDFI